MDFETQSFSIFQDGYLDMLHDEDRNNKYFAAIKSAVEAKHGHGEKAIVLDIGTGCGLLSMMAVSAGADIVYACEELDFIANAARLVITRNKMSHKIKLIKKNSRDLIVGKHGDMPCKANILVSEIVGCEFLGEGIIETINHANQYLITSDCIHVPEKAFLYAQVVDFPMVDKTNTFVPFSLPNGTEIKFPKCMETCSKTTNGTMEMQLSSLPKELFSKLSNPITIFEFNWKTHTPEYSSVEIEFESLRKGNANAIFSWWDLHLDAREENIISVKPIWAGGSSVNWRYGWMPLVYSGHSTIDLNFHEGTRSILRASHDTTNIWMEIYKVDQHEHPSNIRMTYSAACTCSIHSLMDSCKIGEANCSPQTELYVKALKNFITPGETVVLVLSEPQGTILHLMAAGLGARKVFVILTDSKQNQYYQLAAKKIVDCNTFSDKIQFLSTSTNNLTSADFNNIKVDLVIGDPYFGAVQGRPYFEMPSKPTWLETFHNLLFWQHLSNLRQNEAILNRNCKIVPCKAVLKGIAVKFNDPVARINAPIDSVCNGQFIVKDFADIFRMSGGQQSSVDHQYLWQYPCIAASETVELMWFDFNEEYLSEGRKINSCSVNLEIPADGFVMWMDWILGENLVISTGPTEEPKILQPINWNYYKRQAVQYNSEHWNSRLRISMYYSYCTRKFLFVFSK